MRIFNWAAIGGALALFGCGSPVPSDMFLTLSVSTRDATVETSINGKPNEFLSSENGSMTGSMPLNKFVSEGANSVTFILSGIELADGGALEPGFLATLEISLKGEIVDTLAPGERIVFNRALSDDETQSLIAGDAVTITEAFEVNKAALAAIKQKAAAAVTPSN